MKSIAYDHYHVRANRVLAHSWPIECANPNIHVDRPGPNQRPLVKQPPSGACIVAGDGNIPIGGNNDAGTDCPQGVAEQLRIKLDIDKKKLPLVYLLRDDDTVVATLKNQIVAVPGPTEDYAETAIYAILVNGKGKPMVQTNGSYAVTPAIPLQLHVMWQPDKLLSVGTVEDLTDMSESTIERRVSDGTFPKPYYPTLRGKRWRWGDIQECRSNRGTGIKTFGSKQQR